MYTHVYCYTWEMKRYLISRNLKRNILSCYKNTNALSRCYGIKMFNLSKFASAIYACVDVIAK